MNSLTRISARLPGADALRQAASAWAHSDGVTWVFIGKTLLTAFLALWLAYRLELPQPNTVLVSAFIVLQPQSGQVLAKSFYRILGTLAGLTVMVTFIALFAQERVLFLLCVSIWVGLCTAGAARYRDFRAYACLLAGYTAVMIGIPATLHPEGAFMAALWRVLEITLGIACTGLVSALVLPQTSSAALRNALDTRFGDFAGLAAAGLEGTLDHARFEQAAARIAAEAVGLENLRNVTAFEDPHMRLRSGRLARLNSEFMQLTTRFHALQRLLDRLRERQAGAVLEVLMPCLVEVGGLLAGWHGRPLRDADAAFLAAQLEHCRQQLMPQIREARARLAHACPREADQLDFETAAELLFRFAGDLHDYAQTHASLAAHRHAREQWKERFTPKANAVAAAGVALGAVRIDSGELGVLARQTRQQLDQLGATTTRIVVSGDLDEFSIAALRAEPVDSYGVGTSLVTGSGAPTAGMVYKLVEVEGRPVEKRSSHKESKGGRKSALRRHKPTGTALEEVVYRVGEGQTPPALGPYDRELPIALLRNGEPAAGLPTLEQSRERLRAALVSVPWEGLKLSHGEPAIPTTFL